MNADESKRGRDEENKGENQKESLPIRNDD